MPTPVSPTETLISFADPGHRVEGVLHEVEQRLPQFAGDAAHQRPLSERLVEMDDAALRALLPEGARHRHHLLHHHREVHRVLAGAK
jgi:hypothetical protein